MYEHSMFLKACDFIRYLSCEARFFQNMWSTKTAHVTKTSLKHNKQADFAIGRGFSAMAPVEEQSSEEHKENPEPKLWPGKIRVIWDLPLAKRNALEV